MYRPAAGHLTVWLETLRREFADRILPVGDAVALEWGAWRRSGLAATPTGSSRRWPIAHNLVLVTRNTADFEDTRAPLVNRWRRD
jgi:predicted nucleic acid-binding protein